MILHTVIFLSLSYNLVYYIIFHVLMFPYCVSILVSQVIVKYQKVSEENLNIPVLFAFSL